MAVDYGAIINKYEFDKDGYAFPGEGILLKLNPNGTVSATVATNRILDAEHQKMLWDKYDYDPDKYVFDESGRGCDRSGNRVRLTDEVVIRDSYDQNGNLINSETVESLTLKKDVEEKYLQYVLDPDSLSPGEVQELFDFGKWEDYDDIHFDDDLDISFDDEPDISLDIDEEPYYEPTESVVSRGTEIAWCSNGNGLDKEEVIEYLRKVVDIQTNREECERVCGELNKEYKRVKIVPAAPVQEKAKPKIVKGILIGILAYSLIDQIMMAIHVGFFGLVLGLAAFAASIYYFIVKPNIDSKNNYEQAVKAHEEAEANSKAAVITLKAEYTQIKVLEENCDNSLAALFSPGVIKPDYQNLMACSYILNVLENGHTHTLERDGADPGAYRLYEVEMRERLKINELKSINGKLDQMMNMMAQNNMIMQQKLNEINYNVQSAVGELKQIKYISAFTAMNTANIARDTAEIKQNTADTAWYSRCAAMNTSNGLGDELRVRTGLDFNY